MAEQAPLQRKRKAMGEAGSRTQKKPVTKRSLYQQPPSKIPASTMMPPPSQLPTINSRHRAESLAIPVGNSIGGTRPVGQPENGGRYGTVKTTPDAPAWNGGVPSSEEELIDPSIYRSRIPKLPPHLAFPAARQNGQPNPTMASASYLRLPNVQQAWSAEVPRSKIDLNVRVATEAGPSAAMGGTGPRQLSEVGDANVASDAHHSPSGVSHNHWSYTSPGASVPSFWRPHDPPRTSSRAPMRGRGASIQPNPFA